MSLTKLTRIPQTIVISNAVGMTWKTIEERMKDIPLTMSSILHTITHLVPRSIALVSPPVCLSRWNFISMLSKCSNVSLATFPDRSLCR